MANEVNFVHLHVCKQPSTQIMMFVSGGVG